MTIRKGKTPHKKKKTNKLIVTRKSYKTLYDKKSQRSRTMDAKKTSDILIDEDELEISTKRQYSGKSKEGYITRLSGRMDWKGVDTKDESLSKETDGKNLPQDLETLTNASIQADMSGKTKRQLKKRDEINKKIIANDSANALLSETNFYDTLDIKDVNNNSLTGASGVSNLGDSMKITLPSSRENRWRYDDDFDSDLEYYLNNTEKQQMITIQKKHSVKLKPALTKQYRAEIEHREIEDYVNNEGWTNSMGSQSSKDIRKLAKQSGKFTDRELDNLFMTYSGSGRNELSKEEKTVVMDKMKKLNKELDDESSKRNFNVNRLLTLNNTDKNDFTKKLVEARIKSEEEYATTFNKKMDYEVTDKRDPNLKKAVMRNKKSFSDLEVIENSGMYSYRTMGGENNHAYLTVASTAMYAPTNNKNDSFIRKRRDSHGGYETLTPKETKQLLSNISHLQRDESDVVTVRDNGYEMGLLSDATVTGNVTKISYHKDRPIYIEKEGGIWVLAPRIKE